MEYRVEYRTADLNNWKGRVDHREDRESFRWHQIVKRIDLERPLDIKDGSINFCFLGFCCDRGISNNMGRTGSATGPLTIREQMCNLPVNFAETTELWDAGNIFYCGQNLAESQKRLALEVEKLMRHNYFPVVLGGGHELAYGHYSGIRQNLGKSPGILNLDAHFDLRPYKESVSSGTMFAQIYDDSVRRGDEFSYLCLGIQSCANTVALFRKAESTGTEYVMAKDMKQLNPGTSPEALDTFLEREEDIYMTLCADVISSAYAPGVSAPQPFGLDPETVVSIVKQVAATGKLRAFDIAEVSPGYDSDNITARMAAVIIFALVNGISGLKCSLI